MRASVGPQRTSNTRCAKDGSKARTRLGHFVGQDTEDLSESDVCRAAVESVAENTSDGVVAPMLYGALLGAPGHAGIQGREYAGLDGRLRAPSLRRPRMGLCPPGRSRQPGAVENYDAVHRGHLGMASSHALIAVRYGPLTASPNAGMAEAAFAGALGVRLGGANTYGGVLREGPALGDGRACLKISGARCARCAAAACWPAF